MHKANKFQMDAVRSRSQQKIEVRESGEIIQTAIDKQVGLKINYFNE
jgi:hypothetical protein